MKPTIEPTECPKPHVNHTFSATLLNNSLTAQLSFAYKHYVSNSGLDPN